MLSIDYFLSNPFLVDVISGGAAGIVSGLPIAPVEYLKVYMEVTPREQRLSGFKNSKIYTNMMKSILPFSINFGCVCALEFSVNKRIEKNYGEIAGVTASAVTGATLLTVADHLMFRREKKETTMKAFNQLFKIRNNALWTGFTPMIARESIFITSVMHLGPSLGKILQGNSNDNPLFWSSIGRIMTGIVTTLISQPFDMLARVMQLTLYENPNQKPTILNCLKKLQKEYQNSSNKFSHPLFRGAIPRMGLATFGGTVAGGFFDYFRMKLYIQ